MNKVNKESLLHRAKTSAVRLRERVAVGSLVALSSASAFAGGSGAPDTSAITGEFTIYKVAAVALVIAFCVVLWSKRGANLLRP